MFDRKTPLRKRVKNLSLAAVSAQAGCVTLIIAFGALFLGLWLDSLLGYRGPCTFGMLILSVPISLYAMLRIALGAISLIEPPNLTGKPDEETDFTGRS